MKRIVSITIVLAGSVLLLTDCRHDSQIPEQEVSFSTDIFPIVQLNCQHSGCHGTFQTGPFVLDTYEEIMDKGEIKAGDPKHSEFYKLLVEKGEDRMPADPYPAISERNRKLIYIWIAQGAKNN
jgi:hypothetical protein